MSLNTMHLILHDHSLGKCSCHALPDLILTTARHVAQGGLVGLFGDRRLIVNLSKASFSQFTTPNEQRPQWRFQTL